MKGVLDLHSSLCCLATLLLQRDQRKQTANKLCKRSQPSLNQYEVRSLQSEMERRKGQAGARLLSRTIYYMIGLFSSHVVAWVRFPSVLIVESRRLREKKRTRTTIIYFYIRGVVRFPQSSSQTLLGPDPIKARVVSVFFY